MYGRRTKILKFEDGEEIKPCTECTKIEQLGDNTTEIKHRNSKTRIAINALNSIWWHKNITKTENCIFNKLEFRTFWFMVQKYGKSLPEK